ncbi:DUF7554 family protein [Haloplanus halobius]|uniref:DUF7554 family protein n=1 Tax=Haloplanus halobius TaxID=2934938 RepID=UPI00200F87FF|nr:hypothetical protein [Haloplanus sp. XH21]
MNRGSIDVEDLLKLVLILVVVWLALSVVEQAFDIVFGLFGFLQPLIGLLIAIVIILWLLDRI